MAAIDIGSEATSRVSLVRGGTFITFNNPSNGTGTIDTVQLYVGINSITNCKAGTFSGSGTSWDDRDYATLGTVLSGSIQTFTGLSINVITNDVIGTFFDGPGYLYCDFTGDTGIGKYGAGDAFGTGAQTYDTYTAILSLYGTGVTSVVAPTVTTCASKLMSEGLI